MTSFAYRPSSLLRPRTGAFTLRHADGCHYLFGWTGKDLRQLSGRALRDHDFISLWQPGDQVFVQAHLDDVRRYGHPKTITARAFTLSGENRDCCFEFTKLAHPGWRNAAMGCRWRTKANAKLPAQPFFELMLDS